MKTQIIRRITLLSLLLSILTSVLFQAELHAQSRDTPKELSRDVFVIRANGGDVRFQLEIANTPETRREGLMFRENLDRYKGMFLDYGLPVRAGIWMKNVLFPLDILFVDQRGKIESIISRAIPNSTETHRSVGKVRGVIEINGGMTEKFGIKPGDTVLHQTFGNVE